MSQSLAKGPETKQPLPRLRPDLVISQQTQESRTYYILKDPISMQYLRLARHERFITGLLDGKRTLDDIGKLLQENFAEAEFDPDRAPQEVLQFLHQLSEKNFLLLSAGPAVATVLERKKDRWKRLLKKVRSNIFFFRIPMFDPDRLLTRTYPFLRFIWTRWVMFLSVALLVVATVMVLGRWDRLLDTQIEDFFTLYNIFLFWLAFIGVKVIHEFGHGFTCKNYGGEVHEMGVLFLAFTPALYCDTTDAWMMPKRAHKVLVSSAGIYVELIVASFAAFVWCYTQPGVVNQLAMSVMFLCSFSTLVFNANPLLKYDGYYMLSDAIEVPNLQQKSYAYVMQQLRCVLFGEKPETAQFSQVPLPQKHLGFFATYSILSYFYRWFILFAIFMFVSQMLKPFGLEQFGKLFALFSVFSSMIFPVAMSGYYFFKSRRTKPDPEPLTRPLTICAAVVVALVMFAKIPIPQNVIRSCVLAPREGYVRAVAPGFIREVKVRDGDPVKEGQALAILENIGLTTQAEQLRLEQETTKIHIQQAFADNDPSALQKARAEYVQIAASLKKMDRDLGLLTLRAPCDGVVEGRQLEDFRGRWLEIGRTFCQVSPAEKMRVFIPLDQREAKLVTEKQPVTLRVYGCSRKKFHGTVTTPALALLREIRQTGIAARTGGDVPTKMDPRGIERPTESLYEVELEIDNPDKLLRPGMSGRAKIYCGNTTIVRLMVEAYRNLVHFDLQM